MNDFTKFENLQFLFDNNPRMNLNDVMDIAKALVCYERLGGKPNCNHLGHAIWLQTGCKNSKWVGNYQL